MSSDITFFTPIQEKYDEKFLVKALDRLPVYMTDDDLRAQLGPDLRIFKYSDLDDYESIEDVLPHDGSYCIILIESQINRGHFVAMSRQNNTIIQFDSYSGQIDKELNYISTIMKRILGEYKDTITKLIKKSNLKTIWNKVKYQSNKKVCGVESAICGRACIVFIQLCCRMGFSLQEMEKFIYNKRDYYEHIYDLDLPLDLIFCFLVK